MQWSSEINVDKKENLLRLWHNKRSKGMKAKCKGRKNTHSRSKTDSDRRCSRFIHKQNVSSVRMILCCSFKLKRPRCLSLRTICSFYHQCIHLFLDQSVYLSSDAWWAPTHTESMVWYESVWCDTKVYGVIQKWKKIQGILHNICLNWTNFKHITWIWLKFKSNNNRIPLKTAN